MFTNNIIMYNHINTQYSVNNNISFGDCYVLFLDHIIYLVAAPVIPVVIPLAVNFDYYITQPNNMTGAPG